jgi:hypothetical protein
VRAGWPAVSRATRSWEAGPAGEGRYAIVDHDGHTHLVYALELPQEPGLLDRHLLPLNAKRLGNVHRLHSSRTSAPGGPPRLTCELPTRFLTTQAEDLLAGYQLPLWLAASLDLTPVARGLHKTLYR